MNLLDTHTLAWAINEPARLSPSARRIIEDGDYQVSAVSLWEMLLKKHKPQPLFPGDPLPWWRRYVVNAGVRILAIEWSHISHLDVLPGPATDPFDRMLVCQCVVENFRLVTKDSVLRDNYQGHLNIVW